MTNPARRAMTSDPQEPLDVEGLRKVAEAATPGPWRVNRKTELLVSYDGEEVECDYGFNLPEDRDFAAMFNPALVLRLLSAEEERQAAESRATKAEGELERVKGALREIAALRMTREQFIGQGPAFACRQVERAVSIAEAALSPTPQGGEEPPTPTQEGA